MLLVNDLLKFKMVIHVPVLQNLIQCYFLLNVPVLQNLIQCYFLLHCKGFSHFATKNNSVFVIFLFQYDFL